MPLLMRSPRPRREAIGPRSDGSELPRDNLVGNFDRGETTWNFRRSQGVLITNPISRVSILLCGFDGGDRQLATAREQAVLGV